MHHTILFTFYELSLRLSELVKLREVVKAPGGYRSRGSLFLQESGTPLTASYLQHMVKHYAQKAGIASKTSPRTLRHSHATHSLEAGVDLFTLKKALGHRSLSSTLIHAHLRYGLSVKIFLLFNNLQESRIIVE